MPGHSQTSIDFSKKLTVFGGLCAKKIGSKPFALIRRLARRKRRPLNHSKRRAGQRRNNRESRVLQRKQWPNLPNETAPTKIDSVSSSLCAPAASLRRRCWPF